MRGDSVGERSWRAFRAVSGKRKLLARLDLFGIMADKIHYVKFSGALHVRVPGARRQPRAFPVAPRAPSDIYIPPLPHSLTKITL